MTLIFVDPIHRSGLDKSLSSNLKDQRFQEILGISSWTIAVQNGPQKKQYCIQSIECDNPQSFPFIFQQAVQEKMNQALWLNEVFGRHLPTEHSLKGIKLKVEPVLDLAIDPFHPSRGYDYHYILPLLPHKCDAHKEYCRAAMHEKREQTIIACKEFGMIHMKKWIQEKEDGSNYVIYHQRMTKPLSQARKFFLSAKDDLRAWRATEELRAQTGATFDELCPEVVYIQVV